MNELVQQESSTQSISRFQSLQAGQYWRALEAVQSEGIAMGEVLLIESIRCVDDTPHTVILRPHPLHFGKDKAFTYIASGEDGTTIERRGYYGDEHRFLLQDFLRGFEYEPDYQRVRSDELQAVQAKITALQSELLEAQSNPSVMADVVAIGLSATPPDSAVDAAEPMGSGELASLATGSVVQAIGTGITEQGIAQLRLAAGREHQIATIKSKWIQGKTSEIATTIKAMTPFYEEQAAAALAQTEDVRSYVTKLLQGIDSLDLYVGKDVDVLTIREGASAPSDIPLTFVQKKLLMDEELAVFVDVDERFDFSQKSTFFDALREHDGLVHQIFPTPRCVLVMATTRRNIDYGNPLSSAIQNQKNAAVFMLVRNGMNIYCVTSPVESHLGASRLFPSVNDQNAIFRGMDGSRVKFEDVAYTDKLARHDAFALHYKRFLLLVCGLDHRLKLFGDFYPGEPSLHFVSMAFQEAHCKFLHDDDGTWMLPGEKRQSVGEWVKEKNAFMRSGSRVLCNWDSVMNPDTAPGACKPHYRGDGFETQYSPKNAVDVVVAFRDKDATCVEVQVSGRTRQRFEDRTFQCRVNLTALSNQKWGYDETAFLCLDAVSADEVHWYIHNRPARTDHLTYIRFFKRALKFIQAERLAEADARSRLVRALEDGRIATGPQASDLVDRAARAWRAANRGAELPRFVGQQAPSTWKSLLDQMYMLAGEGRSQVSEVEEFVRGLGYEPLRLVLSGGAKLVVYAAPATAERDDRLQDHVWVHRIMLNRGKKKLGEASRRWEILPPAMASETTLHQWDAALQWMGTSFFASYEAKQNLMNAASAFKQALEPFTSKMSPAQHAVNFADWSDLRNEILADAKFVREPCLAIPFGVVHYPRAKEAQYLCVGSRDPHVVLYHLAPDARAQAAVRSEFVRPFRDKTKGYASFDADVRKGTMWQLISMGTALHKPARQGVFVDNRDGAFEYAEGRAEFNPELSAWLQGFAANVKGYSNIWLAEDALDESGSLVLDAMLGIVRPDDLDPVELHDCRLRSNGSTPLPKYWRWIDISPKSAKSNQWERRTTELPNGVKLDDGLSYQSSGCSYRSPQAARESILAELQAEGAGMVPATELGSAYAPPDGVERWYVVEKTDE